MAKNEDRSNPLESGSSLKHTKTQTPHSFTADTPRKKKLKYKIRSLNRRLQNTRTNEQNQGLENFKSLCDEYLDKPLSEIIKIQTDLKMKTI